jgi:hypothetical protein
MACAPGCPISTARLIRYQPHEAALERGEHTGKVVPPLEHQPMFGNECERPLLHTKLGAFLDPHFWTLAMPPECGEARDITAEIHCIIAPMTCCDHSPV